MRDGLRGVLELLRAPLLLSPIADVATGCAVACATTLAWQATGGATFGWPFDRAATGRLALAAACGCCLLAAGMVLNGLVDLPEDRRRKPERPLPRGAVSLRAALWLYALLTALALAVAAGSASGAMLAVVSAIVGVTLAYHLLLKRQRLAGCLALGCARGLDLLLGAVALLGAPVFGTSLPGSNVAGIPWPGALQAAGVYALYMTGASLHASTDDETGSRRWSRAGLGLCLAALLVALLPLGGRLAARDPSAWLGAAVALLAAARLAHAIRTRPPPAITGVALSGLYLMLAALALALGAPAARLPIAALALLLFLLSRLLFRAFPPT